MEGGKKVVRLKSIDGQVFLVPEAVAMHSTVLRRTREVIDPAQAEQACTVRKADAEILSMVIDYCTHHVGTGNTAGDSSESADREGRSVTLEEVSDWDRQFVDVSTDKLLNLLCTAHYLDIKGLVDLICLKFNRLIEGKTVNEIRKDFNIDNGFTADEEKEIRDEHAFALE